MDLWNLWRLCKLQLVVYNIIGCRGKYGESRREEVQESKGQKVPSSQSPRDPRTKISQTQIQRRAWLSRRSILLSLVLLGFLWNNTELFISPFVCFFIQLPSSSVWSELTSGENYTKSLAMSTYKELLFNSFYLIYIHRNQLNCDAALSP